jgi:hypothetical protein
MKRSVCVGFLVFLVGLSFAQVLFYYHAPSGRDSWLMPSLRSPMSYYGYTHFPYSYAPVSAYYPQYAYPVFRIPAFSVPVMYQLTGYGVMPGSFYGFRGYTLPPVINPGYSTSIIAPYWGHYPVYPLMPQLYWGW